MKSTSLTELKDTQMQEVCGGGFAYDVGRALRFIALGGLSTNPSLALIDWEINKMENEVAQDSR